MQRLPSNTIIFMALNNILDHLSNIIAEKYLISSLSKIEEDIVIQWMQLHLNDEKRLSKFCQCLRIEIDVYSGIFQYLSTKVCEEQWELVIYLTRFLTKICLFVFCQIVPVHLIFIV